MVVRRRSHLVIGRQSYLVIPDVFTSRLAYQGCGTFLPADNALLFVICAFWHACGIYTSQIYRSRYKYIYIDVYDFFRHTHIHIHKAGLTLRHKHHPRRRQQQQQQHESEAELESLFVFSSILNYASCKSKDWYRGVLKYDCTRLI